MENIKSTTAIHDFPDIYNANNKEILDAITALEKKLTVQVEEQKKNIDRLNTSVRALTNKVNQLVDINNTDVADDLTELSNRLDTVIKANKLKTK